MFHDAHRLKRGNAVYQRTRIRSEQRALYLPTDFTFPVLLTLLLFLVFRASLRSRCEAEPHRQTRERTGATVTERIIFSATDAASSSATQRLPLLDV